MNRFKITRKIAILGIAANIFLLIVKLAAGFLSKSQAMIADGFNSAGDVFASVMTLTGNKIASNPRDENHPYGHGKAEYIFSMIISFSLLLVAYKIFMNSLDSIIKKQKIFFNIWLILTAIVTIGLKLWLFIYSRKAGKRENNLLIIANSEDHRNDLFVTTSTLLGIGASELGFNWADGTVGIGISLWIAYTGIKIFSSSYYVLMDTGNKELRNEVISKILEIHGVDHVDSVITKPIGVQYIAVVKVSVNKKMTVEDSHIIASAIKQKLLEEPEIGDVLVHVNPA